MPKDRRLFIARLIALILVVALTIYILTISEQRVEQLETLGYIGVALITLLANATVLIPAPGLAVVFTMGARFDPLLVGLAAGLGGALGEISGYLAGFSGQGVIENYAVYQRSVRWMKKYGVMPIIGLSMIPNPVFDITGIAAGALRMPLWKFLSAAWIGITIKMTLVAFAGNSAFALPWLIE